MIPYGAIAAAVAAQAFRGQKGGAKGPKDPSGTVPLIWFFGLVTLSIVYGLTEDHRVYWPRYLTWPAVLVLLFPWPIARGVLVPLGLPRAAYWVARLATVTFKLDYKGGAALAGAWALLRQRQPDLRVAEWLEGRLCQGRPLRGAGVVAAGLLRAARGDLDGARALCAAVGALDERVCPKVAERLAGEWLAVDAAARGAWGEIAARGAWGEIAARGAWGEIAARAAGGPEARAPERRSTATTRFLRHVAVRLLGADLARRPLGVKPGSRFALALSWLLARERLETWPLLVRAWNTPLDAPPPPAPREVALPDGDRLAQALALHAAALGHRAEPRRAVQLVEVERLLGAWDLALADPAVRRLAAERALALGVPSASGGESALAKLTFSVEEELAALLLEARLPVATLSGGTLSERVVSRLRNQLLDELELTSEALRARVVEQKELPAVDEWREWLHLCRMYERAVTIGGLELRRLAFAKVHPDGCKLAVWLWNTRGQRPLANAMFRWLLDEARAVDDARAVELQQKNVACGWE